MNAGIEMSLQTLARTAQRDAANETAEDFALWSIRDLALRSTAGLVNHRDKMRALVDDLHRATASGRLIDGSVLDADDACLFVATSALCLGIPCRFIAERYGQSWTVRLGYEVDGQWETIDCMNQVAMRDLDERIVGEELRP